MIRRPCGSNAVYRQPSGTGSIVVVESRSSPAGDVRSVMPATSLSYTCRLIALDASDHGRSAATIEHRFRPDRLLPISALEAQHPPCVAYRALDDARERQQPRPCLNRCIYEGCIKRSAVEVPTMTVRAEDKIGARQVRRSPNRTVAIDGAPLLPGAALSERRDVPALRRSLRVGLPGQPESPTAGQQWRPHGAAAHPAGERGPRVLDHPMAPS